MAEDTKYDNFTLGQAEQMLFDYFKRHNLSYEIGTSELRKYLFEQLMYKNDTELKKEPNYELILDYAASYLNESEGFELQQINKQQISNYSSIDSQKINSSKFNMNHVKNKKIKQIKEENKVTDKQINKSLTTPKYVIPSEGGFSVNTAVSYAKRNAYTKENDKYGYYNGDGDCTNFVSQVIEAGGKSINRPYHVNANTPNIWDTTSYWYNGIWITHPNGPKFRKATTSWIRVSHFYEYWSQRVRTFETYSPMTIGRGSKTGDVIQYKRSRTGQMWHTTFVTGKASDGETYITQHSDPKLNQPIVLPNDSSYYILKFSEL
ncbi:amidase domain-containing protein [Bacillus pseudomycoides]